MNRAFSSLIGAVILTTTVSACAGFEHNETLLSPSAPSLPTLPGGSGTLTGTWSSVLPANLNSTTCSSFQWSISSQTPNSLAGQFYAICAGIILVSGNVSGQLNAGGTEVALQLNGTATVQGVISCPFTITGTGYITGNESIRIPYSGDTCLGPVHGEDTLRRPAPNQPPPPPPAPPEPEPPAPPNPPTPTTNPFHVAPGALTVERAEQVIYSVAREFPYLTDRTPGSEDEGIQLAEELVLRSIWHLKLLGYDSGRQRNPSGAISNDKLTILVNGQWRAFDIASMGYAGRRMQVIFLEIGSPNPIAYPGQPD